MANFDPARLLLTSELNIENVVCFASSGMSSGRAANVDLTPEHTGGAVRGEGSRGQVEPSIRRSQHAIEVQFTIR